MTHGKTYNKSPRRINHKATKNKTNTGTTALERSVEQTTGGFKTSMRTEHMSVIKNCIRVIGEVLCDKTHILFSTGHSKAVPLKLFFFVCAYVAFVLSLFVPHFSSSGRLCFVNRLSSLIFVRRIVQNMRSIYHHTDMTASNFTICFISVTYWLFRSTTDLIADVMFSMSFIYL